LATDVTMPRLSDSMEEGTVLKWLVEEGGEVKRGEPLVEIETDKANMTYEADTDGALIEILAQEGDTLAIGETIARIGDPGEAGSGGKAAKEKASANGEAEVGEQTEGEGVEQEGREPVGAGAASKGEARGAAGAGDGGGETQAGTATKERAPSGNGDGGRVKASPVARRMARELGVELARLEGSGPGGRIVKADVQAAAEGGGAAPAEAAPEAAPAAPEERAPEPQRGEAGAKGEAEIQELTRLQQTISRRMAESKATAPDFSIALTVDMTQAVELRKRLKEVTDPAPSFNDMVVKAAATALREHPRVNGAYRDGKFELYERVNVGVAVAAQDALVVPTVFDADRKSLGQIARDARAVAEKVRDRTVTPPELSGATFTVSNLGMFGIEQFTAIINPPQAAILTVGALAKRPAVDDTGRIVARDQMQLSLVCDHRILYGADGAKFLARVKELLEQPLSLAL
jgi:pyruvate dehydrogenase E2 component (dihydrolipoamide acetyltransferase)